MVIWYQIEAITMEFNSSDEGSDRGGAFRRKKALASTPFYKIWIRAFRRNISG
jgi:hypothetical protein